LLFLRDGYDYAYRGLRILSWPSSFYPFL